MDTLFASNFGLGVVSILIFFSGLKDCTSIEEFDVIGDHYMNLSKKDKSYIVETTGCLYPCNYLEYRIGSKRTTNVGQFGLWVTFGSVATTVEKSSTVTNLTL